MELLAHIKPGSTPLEGVCMQSLQSHAQGVAELAESCAEEFGFGKWGYVMGLLHDKGKEKKTAKITGIGHL